jgi:L-aspartate oxidase
MQFHPTALAVKDDGAGASLPLLTEALRGAGALLLDASGNRFMLTEHPAAELAPRDVVARAIHHRTSSGQDVFLDLRPVFASGKSTLFPQALEAAREAGFDPQAEPLPVTPAAHYHMGGVQTDQAARTSIAGLWACGEVATTGIHGANRLASNSLLEGLVYARRVAKDVRNSASHDENSTIRIPHTPILTAKPDESGVKTIFESARATMTEHVGIFRSATGLESALSMLSDLEYQLCKAKHGENEELSCAAVVRWSEVRNVILVGRLVTLAALQREESRGAHYRDDFPGTKTEWQRRQKMTIGSLGERLNLP